MKKLLHMALLLLSIAQLTACSFSQLTVRASMPMIEGGMTAMNRETDLQLADAAIPAHISLVEGLLINDPNNRKLRLYAAEAYYGYAFGFVEDASPARAANLYDRCYRHGRQVLTAQGLNDNILDGDLDGLQQQVNKLGQKTVPALFWTASCWSKAIDLNRDKARSLAQLPKAVMLMQRVLELDEHFYLSGPHLFFGAYYGSKPPMLGGNYELSEYHFDQANKANQGKLLLVNLLKAQYLERQRFNQQGFHDLLTQIINASSALLPEQALINQISKHKATLLLEKEQQWF